jgi:predicted pyridoxine 5'-phosphate oxidase superfamily flavin-nucleotide-binding protein
MLSFMAWLVSFPISGVPGCVCAPAAPQIDIARVAVITFLRMQSIVFP